MNKFLVGVVFVLENEGGYVKDPTTGEEAKYGITKKSYPSLDIQGLEREEAIRIYKRDFWDDKFWSKINDPTVAIKIFDFAVNVGPKRATDVAIEATKWSVVSNIADIINEIDPEEYLDNLLDAQIAFYDDVIAEKPKLRKYRAGWINRLHRMPKIVG